MVKNIKVESVLVLNFKNCENSREVPKNLAFKRMIAIFGKLKNKIF